MTYDAFSYFDLFTSDSGSRVRYVFYRPLKHDVLLWFGFLVGAWGL